MHLAICQPASRLWRMQLGKESKRQRMKCEGEGGVVVITGGERLGSLLSLLSCTNNFHINDSLVVFSVFPRLFLTGGLQKAAPNMVRVPCETIRVNPRPSPAQTFTCQSTGAGDAGNRFAAVQRSERTAHPSRHLQGPHSDDNGRPGQTADESAIHGVSRPRHPRVTKCHLPLSFIGPIPVAQYGHGSPGRRREPYHLKQFRPSLKMPGDR
jgi:hypothetical protein